MKHKAKRVLAWILSVFMLFTSVNPAYAAEIPDAEQTQEVHQHYFTDDNSAVQTMSAEPVQTDQSAGICYIHGDLNGDGFLNSQDAIYLLGYQNVPDSYPLESYVDPDMNGDGKKDINDVYYLLHVSIWPQKYSDWVKEYHVYNEPVWSWKEDNTVTATFSCKCQKEEQTVVKDASVKTDTVAATCYAAGSKTTKATVTFDGKEYTDSKVEVIAAASHNFGDKKVPSCTEDVACINEGCTYVAKATGHNYKLTESVNASCTTAGSETYVCEVCQDTYVKQTASKTDHSLDLTTKKTVLKDAATCTYVETYQCTACQETVETESFVKHTYVASISKEANCTEPGVKTYTCSDCGDTKTEAIEKDENVHAWNAGEKSGNITTFTCARCNAKKTAIDSKEETSAEVSKDDIQNSDEIALKDAAIKMDSGIKESLGENVTISAEKTNKESLNLSEELKAQIAGEVYDFSLQSDGKTISDFGNDKITITIPYTLQAGDDPDCIDVWYIDDSGEPVVCMGKYSNGFVTFTTNHFSYYTVTRLTPSQRCEKYGHTKDTKVVAATCDKEGYTLEFCQRCGESTKTNITEATGHKYDKKVKNATCKAAGSETFTCSVCKDTYSNILPALGHDWKLAEGESKAATCAEAGANKYKCGNADCTEEYTETLDKLAHEYEETVIAPTCENNGYTLHTCKLCQDEYQSKQVAALGHQYDAEFTWNDKNHSASLTLTCTNKGCDSVILKDATIETTGKYADCVNDGNLTYTAKVIYNGKEFIDKKTATQKAIGHVAGSEKISDEKEHSFVCVNCGGKADAEAHTWKVADGTVITEQTCNQDGLVEFECTDCGYKLNKTLPKTGLHDYDAYGNCKVCKLRKDNCEHNSYHAEYKSIDGVKDAQILVYVCDCGEKISDTELMGDFSFDYDVTSTREKDGSLLTKEVTTYKKTGIVKTSSHYVTNTGSDCKSAIQYQDVYTLNGVQIAEYQYSASVENHTPSYVKEIKTIQSSDGNCSVTYYVTSCNCGKSAEFIEVDSTHDWIGMDNGAREKEICVLCHDIRTWNHQETETTNKTTLKYTTVENQYIDQVESIFVKSDEAHDLKFSYELLGDTCQDGVLEYAQCADPDCGIRMVTIMNGEWGVYDGTHDQVYDLKNYGYDTIITIHHCICGQDSWMETGDCSFEWVDYDEEKKQDILQCPDCGLKQLITRTDDRDADFTHGRYTVNEQISFADEDGTALVSCENKWTSDWHTFSDWNSDNSKVQVFMLGNDCRDGIIVTETCEECGTKDHWFYSSEWHYYITQSSVDLSSELDAPIVLQDKKCACGKEYSVSDDKDWHYSHYSPELDTEVLYSEELELYRTIVYEFSDKKDANCLQACTITVTYLDKDENILVTKTFNDVIPNHDWSAPTFKLLKDTCMDGYEGTEECKDCGCINKWTSYPSEHVRYVTDRIELAEYDICDSTLVIYGCPCGAVSNYEFENFRCQYNWAPSNNNVHIGTCTKCGSIREDTERTRGEKDENCAVPVTGRLILKNRDNVTVIDMTYNDTEYNHDCAFPVVKSWDGSKNCEEGVTYEVTCKDCGYSYTNYTKEHITFNFSQYDLAEYGFCGGTVGENGCLCGVRKNIFNNFQCNFRNVGYDYQDGTSINYYECANCKGKYERHYKVLSQNGCDRHVLTEEWFEGPNGEQFRLSVESEDEEHKFVVDGDYQLNGTSCNDGWSADVTCYRCNKKTHVSGNWHSSYIVGIADIGACDDMPVTKYSCACGENAWVEQPNYCSWNYRFTATNSDAIRVESGVATNSDASKVGRIVVPNADEVKELLSGLQGPVLVEQCSQCKTYRFSCKGEFLYTEGCYNYYKVDYVYAGSKGCFAINGKFGYGNHEMVTTYEFPNEEKKDCRDGVTVYNRCKNCNFYNSQTEYRHISIELDQEEIPGSCNMVLRHFTCPCGKVDRYALKSDCRWSWDYQDGVQVTTCNDCRFVRKMRTSDEYHKDDCSSNQSQVNEIYDAGGAKVKEYTSIDYFDRHLFVLGPNQQVSEEECKNGELLQYYCAVCGKGQQVSVRNHSTQTKQVYFLSDYGVMDKPNAYIETRTCACGIEQGWSSNLDCQWMWLEHKEISGGYEQTYQCKDCSATQKESVIYGEKVGCLRPYTRTITFQFPDASPITIRLDGREYQHEYEKHATLLPGSTSCTDGIKIVNSCKDCGDSYSYTSNDHELFEVESIDVTQYGSVCGGEMVVESCPCGEKGNVSLTDCKCDIGSNYTENWITGTLEVGYHGDVDGFRWIGTQSSICKCAVTDPKSCGFIYRYANYYVPNGKPCKADHYVIYQLGYDEETKTFQRELKVCVGKDVQVHNYEFTSDTSDPNKQISNHTCQECGSTYTITDTYETVQTSQGTENKRRIRHQEQAMNTLNDNHDQKYDYDWQMVYANNDSTWDYTKYSRTERTHADGTVTWWQSDYTYDWSNCTATRVETNSNGYRWEDTYTNHRGVDTDYEVISKASCTQLEKRYYHTQCTICKQDISRPDNYRWILPNNHAFQYDNTKNVYVCSTCGLESVNGVSGSIWMEDMTNRLSGQYPEDYVIGYYKNDSSIEFIYNLGVVLNDKDQHTSDDKDIVLKGIEFTELHREKDGVEAITFNRQKAHDAAKAALEAEGLPADTAYNLRFTFVPAGQDGSLDYAITLTDN